MRTFLIVSWWFGNGVTLLSSHLSLVPGPSSGSRKRVWCSELHILSHGVGPYSVKNVIFKSKNVIITFLSLELEFLMGRRMSIDTQGLGELDCSKVK